MMTERTTELTQLYGQLQGIGQRLGYTVEQIAKTQRRIDEIEVEKAKLAKAVGLIDQAITVISANGVGRIETTVTNGLRLVFDDPTLALKIIKKSGVNGNSYEIEGQQGEVSGPFLDTFGGGIANVTSFLLRIILLKRFKMAKFMVLDESFNNVSAQYLPMVSELLRSLAKDGGFAIFAVTHQPILAASADHIYRAVPQPDAPPVLQKITVAELQTESEPYDFKDSPEMR